MTGLYSVSIVLMLMALGSAPAPLGHAQSTPTASTEPVSTPLHPLETDQSWQVWGLTTSDWARYTQLTASARAYLTPHLTPLQLLGIHARSASEQTRFAQLHAEMSLRRDYQDLLWQARVSQEREKLQALEQSLWASVTDIGRALTGASPTSDYLSSQDPVLAFVDLDCHVQCIELIAKANQRSAATHFYIAGATRDDQLRAWATRHALPLQSVQRGKFTLHHAGDWLDRHGHDATARPLLLRHTGDQYVRITL